MDIYSYLKKDHEEVSKILDQIIESQGGVMLFKEAEKKLLIHSETEEKTFYRALRANKEAIETIDHAKEEHKEITDCLKRINKLDSDDDKKEWLKEIKELKRVVEHHVKEEEGKIFTQAKKILSSKEADSLAEEMDNLKPPTARQGSLINKAKEKMIDLTEGVNKLVDKVKDKIS
jgi:hemerythrin superfamily protein